MLHPRGFMRLLFQSIVFCAVLRGSGASQGVRGSVRDAGSKQPIPAALIAVLGADGRALAATTSGSDGTFVVAWRTKEAVRLRVERLGYVTVTSKPFLLETADTVQSTIQLGVDAIPVDPVIVQRAEIVHDVSGDMAAVQRRMKLGIGRFIQRQAIEDSRASKVSELLELLPGVKLIKDPISPNIVNAYSSLNVMHPSDLSRSRRNQRPSDSGSCPMLLFLDGKPFKLNSLGVNIVHAQDIAVIEVYRGLSEVPAELSTDLARCGVIAIWLKKY
jgi:hypothetical protein